MFGYPSAYVNGNMFAGLFKDSMILRLPDDLREVLILAGGEPFAPMPGRVMREYVTVPESILSNRAKLKAWVGKSQEYAEALPPKEKTKRAPKAAANRSKIRRRKSKI